MVNDEINSNDTEGFRMNLGDRPVYRSHQQQFTQQQKLQHRMTPTWKGQSRQSSLVDDSAPSDRGDEAELLQLDMEEVEEHSGPPRWRRRGPCGHVPL